MKKKYVPIIVMLFIMLLTMNVYASNWWDIYGTIEKSENNGELYNLMPTPANKDEIISVKITVKNIRGWQLLNNVNVIRWDKEAFDIVETNGKYYRWVC